VADAVEEAVIVVVEPMVVHVVEVAVIMAVMHIVAAVIIMADTMAVAIIIIIIIIMVVDMVAVMAGELARQQQQLFWGQQWLQVQLLQETDHIMMMNLLKQPIKQQIELKMQQIMLPIALMHLNLMNIKV
jgi:hypothetical protein